MKRKIIICIIVLAIVLGLVILITNLGIGKKEANIKEATTAFMINEHVDKVKSMDVYYGDKTYYIADYIIDNKEYIGVIDTKYNLIDSLEKNKLYDIKKDYVIGYKNDKIIYEVKDKKNDGIIYYYYDAKSGELINKINLDR